MDEQYEKRLLLEIARLTAALLHVVKRSDDPELRREIADLIWPVEDQRGAP